MYLMYIDPEIDEIQNIQAEIDRIDVALTNATQVESVIARLSQERSQISAKDVERLRQILPHKSDVDPVALAYNISTIASISGLSLTNISYAHNSEPAQETEIGTVGHSSFSFSLETTYVKFIEFLRDIEQSENLYDVTVTSIKIPESDVYQYSVSVNKYYLN